VCGIEAVYAVKMVALDKKCSLLLTNSRPAVSTDGLKKREGTKMKNYFTFDYAHPSVHNGVTMYTMINLVTRIPFEGSTTIPAGARGGDVEHPELLDPHDDIWISESAYVYGDTHIDGRAYIQSARIYSSTLHGLIRIGDIRYGSDPVKIGETTMYCKGRVVTIRDCELDSTQGGSDCGDDELQPIVCISGYATVTGSKLYGDVYIADRSHVAQSGLVDSSVFGYGFVSKSVLTGSAALDGSTAAIRCKLDGTQVSGSVILEDCTFGNKTIKGDGYYKANVRHAVYPYHALLYANG